MTVIVYNHGMLAADRSHSVDGKHLYEACKLVRTKNTIGAAAGTVTACEAFNEYVKTDLCDKPPGLSSEDFIGIAFNSEYVFMVADGTMIQVPKNHAYAIGSGAEIALGALDMGAGAGRAAMIAARRMGCAHYGIDVVSLDTAMKTIFPRAEKLNVNTF